MSCSGRINVSIPREVHTAARIHCVATGKTMAEVVTEALTKLLGEAPAPKTTTA